MLITDLQAKKATDMFDTLANTVRLRILCLLADGELTVGDVERDLRLKQPGLSQQLGELRQSGLVATRRSAKSIFYRLADERTKLLITVLGTIVFEDHERLEALGAAIELKGRPNASTRSGEAAVFAVAKRVRLPLPRGG